MQPSICRGMHVLCPPSSSIPLQQRSGSTRPLVATVKDVVAEGGGQANRQDRCDVMDGFPFWFALSAPYHICRVDKCLLVLPVCLSCPSCLFAPLPPYIPLTSPLHPPSRRHFPKRRRTKFHTPLPPLETNRTDKRSHPFPSSSPPHSPLPTHPRPPPPKVSDREQQRGKGGSGSGPGDVRGRDGWMGRHVGVVQ